MTLAVTAALLVTLTALCSYANARTIRLPGAIGIMVIALALSLALLGLGRLGVPLGAVAKEAVGVVDFDTTVMAGLLSFLLFAGALHVDLARLQRERWAVAFLAIAGVLLSTAIVGVGVFYVLDAIGRPVPLPWCLVFGALISPTDPIAVIAIIRSVGVPAALEVKISGESLFNDGVAVVAFGELVAFASGASLHPSELGLVFLREAVGGAAYGFAIGYLVYLMLSRIDDYEVEVLLTLALVMGGYASALALHVSGPIAMVVAGLLIGSRGRRHAMSERTRAHIDTFWGLIDSILNSVLFVLVGLEMLVLPHVQDWLAPAALAIPVVLVARLLSVGLPAMLPYLRRWFDADAVKVLTWGGLRGGISVALALGLPESPWRPLIVTMTYAVVLFSIIVQGLTIGPLVRRLGGTR